MISFAISTHAPLAGRDQHPAAVYCDVRDISTHAPLAGRDREIGPSGIESYISTHAPLAGRDSVAKYGADVAVEFQPTRPLRGATASGDHLSCGGSYFNPRAPCGARPTDRFGEDYFKNFNPRAPCGARPCRNRARHKICSFQPTRPLRGATAVNAVNNGIIAFQPTRPLRGATAKVYISLCTFLR